MKELPVVQELNGGDKCWEKVFDTFEVRVYLPKTDEIKEIVNFGFRAPYLLILEENKKTMEEAIAFAKESGLAKIASFYGCSVVSVYPTAPGGWADAPAGLFADIIAESRISQYYKDGMAIMWDRFNKKWDDSYIRGAVLRTCLYGFGASADYIAKNCLKTIEGVGLYGPGDITPAVCILQGLSVMPKPERRDIPVLSIGNSDEINDSLMEELDYVMVEQEADYEKDYQLFVGNFRRMMGYLNEEDNLEEMGMVWEPAACKVLTAADNLGDDKDTTEHFIGYVAYYNKSILEEGKKVPLVFCFHGGGDSAMCMTTVSGWYKVAHENNFLLISIENHLNSTATEIMTLLEQLKEKYPIDTEKIYSTGFSMGGCKSWDMFQEYPKVFAAVAPMDATFEVGQNSYGSRMPSINQDVILPVYYVGGEETPLPELPFQEAKCYNRMKYVLKVNRALIDYYVTYEDKENWPNRIWGLDGDVICKLQDAERGNATLTLNLFESEGHHCYSIFGCVEGQGHEVRHHTCDNAWKFMNCFRRKADGSIEGGAMEEICSLYR